jgi:hypothetical protein
MNMRQAFVLVPFCLLGSSRMSDAAAIVTADIAVRVYDSAGVHADVKAAALSLAGATLEAAGVYVWWQPCDGDRARAVCDTPRRDELIVRIVRSPASVRTNGERPLGDAMLDMSTRSPVLATIYLDSVVGLADAAGTDVGALLGRAIAHELGHLLLVWNGHSAHGLMRPVWLAGELRRERAADWMFTARDAAAIRARAGGSRQVDKQARR